MFDNNILFMDVSSILPGVFTTEFSLVKYKDILKLKRRIILVDTFGQCKRPEIYHSIPNFLSISFIE